MTPETALYYSFHRTSAGPTHNFRRSSLGAAAALDELLSIGCKLATKEWVNNHYCFVLWKLAGMVCLDPDAESDPERKRWCWKEVIRQLRYRYVSSTSCAPSCGYPNLEQRYEREIHRGQRPPLRKVVASDANAAAPMVLCVSDISWTEPGNARDGTLLDPEPKLEVTDGWYKVNTEIDEPLKRAVRAGRIRAGHKIAVMNCKVRYCSLWPPLLRSQQKQLDCDKEGGEILEAGNRATLSISANSSHLAPWHAKLGFRNGPFIAALGSLDPFGGVVAAIDVTIVKVYPIAYLEFITLEDGRRVQEGPRNERDEAAAQDAWEVRVC